MIRNEVKNFIKAFCFYRFGVYLRRMRRRMSFFQTTINEIIFKIASKLGNFHSPNRLSYKLVDQFYVRDPIGLYAGRSLIRSTTTLLNHLMQQKAQFVRNQRALVFILRGHSDHLLHNYIVGCALRELGCNVSFVICSGYVEHCGVAQENYGLYNPPFLCKACRKLTKSISLSGFDMIDLNKYKTNEEEKQIGTIASLRSEEIQDFRVDGIPLFKALMPFLMRFYSGDLRKIESKDGEVYNHLKSAVRFLSRYKNLLKQVNPSFLCFFNGLFFPEYLFFMEAKRRKIPTLFTERGMRKNTMFISLIDPAPHYRSDRLWEDVKDLITGEQMRMAETYQENRMKGPEDPLGRKRKIFDGDDEKYQYLRNYPYIILFAPVTHDMVCMEKEGPVKNFFEALGLLSSLAIQMKKKLIVRAHPDEQSPYNPSHYTVFQYMTDHHMLYNEYVNCLDSKEVWDAYRLAKFADAIVIYSGTLGVELAAMGYEVFNIANTHYSHKGFTNDIETLKDFRLVFQSKKQPLSKDKRELALKYLFYYIFIANLPIDEILEENEPFIFSLAKSLNKTKQREQLDLIKQRLAFLLQLRPQVLLQNA